ncbi:MAG TPA: phytanoyl-CoA dioxygenase, partial [Gammaproteobacteria bacterium]|nr:phytanoyl-CoA dioxygenase [Gammaproteobacteria bacterium]
MTGSLSTQQVRHFEQHGYLCPLAGIPAAEAGDYAARLADYEERLGVEPQKYFKIKAHIAAPWMVELGRHSALVDAVESLIGPDILLFGASLFSKKAHDSRFVSWHQDSAYYGLDPHEEVTVWVALTESRRENGCLRV